MTFLWMAGWGAVLMLLAATPGMADEKSPETVQAGTRTMVIASLQADPALAKQFRDQFRLQVLKLSGVEQVDLPSEAVLAVKIPDLARHLGVFGGIYRVGDQPYFILQCDDLLTSEVCAIIKVPAPTSGELKDFIPELVRRLKGIKANPVKPAPESALVNVRPFKVRLTEGAWPKGSEEAISQFSALVIMNRLLKEKDLKVVDRVYNKEVLQYQELCGLEKGGMYNVTLILSGEISQLENVLILSGSLVELKTGTVVNREESELGSVKELESGAIGLVEKLIK